MEYLVVGGQILCSLTAVRFLRDRYFYEGVSNARYTIFGILNLAALFFYLFFYDFYCWVNARCSSDFESGQVLISFAAAAVHFFASDDALESRT